MECALIIQRVFRGFSGRRRARLLSKIRNADRWIARQATAAREKRGLLRNRGAATKIQREWARHRVRKRRHVKHMFRFLRVICKLQARVRGVRVRRAAAAALAAAREASRVLSLRLGRSATVRAPRAAAAAALQPRWGPQKIQKRVRGMQARVRVAAMRAQRVTAGAEKLRKRRNSAQALVDAARVEGGGQRGSFVAKGAAALMRRAKKALGGVKAQEHGACSLQRVWRSYAARRAIARRSARAAVANEKERLARESAAATRIARAYRDIKLRRVYVRARGRGRGNEGMRACAASVV